MIKMVKPKPGDLVCARTTDDVLIKRGSCGVIEGRAGERQAQYSVTFNHYTPWWWQGIISASGGPVRIIQTKYMRDTGRKRKQTFQYFPRLPGRDQAKKKKIMVNVFETDLG